MRDFLSEKMLLDVKHGKDCTLEVCLPGYPDDDELIFKGTAGDCLRYMMGYELPMTGDAYFSFTTNQDNYCGYNFEEIACRMGYSSEDLRQMLTKNRPLSEQIADAASRCDTLPTETKAREQEVEH